MRWLLTSRLLATLALAAAAYGAYTIVSARGDPSWPTAAGKALSSEFVGVVSPVPPSGRVGGGTFVTGRYRVEYEYEVSDQRYRGRANTIQHPASGLRVFYSPTDPSISCLDPGIDVLIVTYCLALAGGLFLASRFAFGAADSER